MLTFYLAMLDTPEEEATFESIYETLKLPCLHAAMAVTGDQGLAEDAVHEGFLAVIRHKDGIFPLPCGKRRSQIVIIVKNKAIDIIRAEKRRASVSYDEAENFNVANGFDLSAYAESKAGLEHLLSCVERLPTLYSVVFQLRYVHELTNTEIAARLGIEAKAVSMRISRAKAMLAKILGEEDIDNG